MIKASQRLGANPAATPRHQRANGHLSSQCTPRKNPSQLLQTSAPIPPAVPCLLTLSGSDVKQSMRSLRPRSRTDPRSALTLVLIILLLLSASCLTRLPACAVWASPPPLRFTPRRLSFNFPCGKPKRRSTRWQWPGLSTRGKLGCSTEENFICFSPPSDAPQLRTLRSPAPTSTSPTARNLRAHQLNFPAPSQPHTSHLSFRLLPTSPSIAFTMSGEMIDISQPPSEMLSGLSEECGNKLCVTNVGSRLHHSKLLHAVSYQSEQGRETSPYFVYQVATTYKWTADEYKAIRIMPQPTLQGRTPDWNYWEGPPAQLWQTKEFLASLTVDDWRHVWQASETEELPWLESAYPIGSHWAITDDNDRQRDFMLIPGPQSAPIVDRLLRTNPRLLLDAIDASCVANNVPIRRSYFTKRKAGNQFNLWATSINLDEELTENLVNTTRSLNGAPSISVMNLTIINPNHTHPDPLSVHIEITFDRPRAAPTLGPNTIRIMGLKPNISSKVAGAIAWQLVRQIQETGIPAEMVGAKFFTGASKWDKPHLDVCFRDWASAEAAMQVQLPMSMPSLGNFKYCYSQDTPLSQESDWESRVYQDNRKTPADSASNAAEKQEMARVAASVGTEVNDLKKMFMSEQAANREARKEDNLQMRDLFGLQMAGQNSVRARMDYSDCRHEIEAKRNSLDRIISDIRNGRSTWTPADLAEALDQKERLQREIHEAEEEAGFAKGRSRRLEESYAESTQLYLAASPRLAITDARSAGVIEEVDSPQAQAFMAKGKGKGRTSLRESTSLPFIDSPSSRPYVPVVDAPMVEKDRDFVDKHHPDIDHRYPSAEFQMTAEDYAEDAHLHNVASRLFKQAKSGGASGSGSTQPPPGCPPAATPSPLGATLVSGEQPVDMFSPPPVAAPKAAGNSGRKTGRTPSKNKASLADDEARMQAAKQGRQASSAASSAAKKTARGEDLDVDDPIETFSEAGELETASQEAQDEQEGYTNATDGSAVSIELSVAAADEALAAPAQTVEASAPDVAVPGSDAVPGPQRQKGGPYANARPIKDRLSDLVKLGSKNKFQSTATAATRSRTRGATPSTSASALEQSKDVSTAGTLGATTSASSSLIIEDSADEDEPNNADSVVDMLLLRKVKEEGEPTDYSSVGGVSE
ncbi:hypothetical protein P7C70_g2344, partial [Phenoliferia sp. Uapishka_3]